MRINSSGDEKYLLDIMTELSFRLFKLIPGAGPDLILNLTKEIYIEKYPKYPIMKPEIIDRLEKSNALLRD